MPAVDTRPWLRTFPSLRPNPAEIGLVAAYSLGSPVNGLIPDLVAAFNGTIYGGAIVEQTPMGKGLSLDGADDYVNIYDGRITNATQGSMGFWVKMRSFGDAEAICSYGGGANAQPGLFALHLRLAGGNYYFGVEQRSDGGGAMTIVRGSTILRAETWYYVELTSDGSAWAIYVNGQPETLTVIAGANNGNWFGDTTVTAPGRTRIGNDRYNALDQDYFDGVIIAGTISDLTRPDSYQRNEYLRGKAAMWRAGYGVAVSSADEGGIVSDSLGKQSGETGIKFGDTVGRWRIETDTIQGKLCKVITCKTAGLLYIPTVYFGQNPTEAAFGTWEWWIRKATNATVINIYFISNQSTPATFNGWNFQIAAGERVWVIPYTGGAGTGNPFWSAIGTWPVASWAKLTNIRKNNGEFSFYKDDLLIPSTGGGGANPFTDASHTISPYVVADMDAGDKIGWSCPTGQNSLKKLVIAT